MRITETALSVPRMPAIKQFKKEQPGKNEPSQPADLAAACLGGNCLASSAGEAYDVRTRSPNREFRLNSAGKGKTMLRTIVIILLVLFLLGALPSWPYSAHWGYYPSGGLGLLLIIVVILIFLDIV
jgi:Protein of unknown function (DUF3309)